MEKRRVRIAVSLILTIILVFGIFSPVGAKPKETVHLQILAVNDFHGQLDPGRSLGGVEYLATLVEQKRAETTHTIFISAGDLIGASPLVSALFHDEATINAFNLMGLDYAVTGNHEFDEGIEELRRMQDGGCHPTDGCYDVPFYGAEFKFLAGNVIRTKNGKTLFSAYKVRAIEGLKVAFVGIALDYTPTIVTPAGTEGVEFLNEEEVINAIAAELKADGINTIVIILHDGGTQNGSPNACEPLTGDVVDVLANTDPEIDLFITGHTHRAYNCGDKDGRIVTSAGSAGNYLTEIDLDLDRETGAIVEKSVNNLSVTWDIPKDPEMVALVDQYRALAAPLANRIIGTITADIKTSSNRMIETPLGDVIADAQLAATTAPENGGAVFAMMNPGGIRADFLYDQISGGEQPGEVTYGEAFTVQPFYNDLVTLTYTGEQIKAVLEQQFVANRMLQISASLTYSYSASAAVGSKVSDIKVNGIPIDMAASYRVTVNNFLAGGGDGFSTLTVGTDKLIGMTDIDALAIYFESNSPIEPGPANRITVLP